jgi:diguanylate cyclase (GGDEF)-like protein
MSTLFSRPGDPAGGPAPTQSADRPRRPPGGIVFTDRALRIRWQSTALRSVLAPASSLTNLVRSADEAEIRRVADAVLGGAEPTGGVRVELPTTDGSTWLGEAAFEAVDPAVAPGPLMVTFHPHPVERTLAGTGPVPARPVPDPVPQAAAPPGPTSPEISYRAGHDQLTALPNRWTLAERLRELLDRGPDGVAAVLLIDLDRLKIVNDSLGHEAGDRLLVEAALRLRSAVRDAGTVARIGGDEFVIVLEGLQSEYEATMVAEAILRAMRPPVLIHERQHVITASIGIVYIEGQTEPAEVLRDADTAMYEAKSQGRDRFTVFDELLRVRAVSRFDVEEDLRRALLAGEFVVHYQPQVSLETGRISSAEALVRWEHPEHGTIFPGAFIGIAEETGLVKDLGQLVLAQACEAAVEFQRRARNGEPIGVSVNVSSRQLDDLVLVEAVQRALEGNGLPPSSLTLELTESAIVADDPKVVLSLGRLRDLGVHLAIDDFGTGYSSLAYLSRIPAHELKIDQSFIKEMDSPEGRAVVAGICGLARGVGLTVVAEGVETDEQAGWLHRLGCDTIQGFVVAKAVPRKDFAKAVAADRSRVFRPPPDGGRRQGQ